MVLYDENGNICKFSYAVDVRQALESGFYFTEPPKKGVKNEKVNIKEEIEKEIEKEKESFEEDSYVEMKDILEEHEFKQKNKKRKSIEE